MKNKIKIFIYSSKNDKSGSKPAAMDRNLDIRGFTRGTFAAGVLGHEQTHEIKKTRLT